MVVEKVRVMFLGRFKNCSRTLKFPDSMPDEVTLMMSLKDALDQRSGPLWDRLGLPEHITEYSDRIYEDMAVFFGDRVLRVLPDGSIRDIRKPLKIFTPEIDTEF